MAGLLLRPGAPFCVSIVPESFEKPVMKALAKKFEPGEDRLASLETTVSGANN